MADDHSTFALRWPFSAAATFVGIMWIAYGWSILAAHGMDTEGGGPLGPGALTNDGYYVAGALNTDAVLRGHEWERLVSSIFLHFGFLHIIMNSAAILQLGRILEMFTTRGRCWLTLLVSGIFGSLATIAWARLSGHPSSHVGASGAGCGLGAALVVLSRGVAGLTEFRKKMITWVIVTLGLGLVPGISGTGHLGGAIGGAIAGLLLGRRGSFQMALDPWSRNLGRLTALLTLAFLAALGLNAVRAPERYEAIDDVHVAINDVHGWLDEKKVPEVGEWTGRLETLRLWSAWGGGRDYLVYLAGFLRNAQKLTGTLPPDVINAARRELAAFSDR